MPFESDPIAAKLNDFVSSREAYMWLMWFNELTPIAYLSSVKSCEPSEQTELLLFLNARLRWLVQVSRGTMG
jgi:hypothetical protein